MPEPLGGDSAPSPEERVAKLRDELTRLYGRRKADELVRQVQEASLRRIGVNASIAVFEGSEMMPLLKTLWEDGLAGLSHSELVRVDDYLSEQSAKHRLVLRVLRHYLDTEEYQAVLTSYELVALLKDRMARITKRSSVIAGLYRRLDHLRYGNPIYNQVSSGRLEFQVYPQMRATENSLAPAGRVEGPSKERVKQVFYQAIQPNPAELWINSGDDPVAVFSRIRERLFGASHTVGSTSCLDVYAVGSAIPIGEGAVREFLDAYPSFNGERHPEGQVAGFIRISKKQ